MWWHQLCLGAEFAVTEAALPSAKTQIQGGIDFNPEGWFILCYS